MTNYDAISAMLYPYDVEPMLIQKHCIDFNIVGEDNYSVDSKGVIAEITVAILPLCLHFPKILPIFVLTKVKYFWQKLARIWDFLAKTHITE